MINNSIKQYIEKIIIQYKNDLKQLEKDFTILEQNIKENEKIINTAINQQQIKHCKANSNK